MGCVATTANAGEPMRYQFKGMTDATYQFELTLDMPTGRVLCVGYVVLSVRPQEGDGKYIRLRMASNSVMRAYAGDDKTAPVTIADVAYPVVSTAKEVGPTDLIMLANGGMVRAPSETKDAGETMARMAVMLLVPRFDTKGEPTWEHGGTEKTSGISSGTPLTFDEKQRFVLRERNGSLQTFVWEETDASREKLDGQPQMTGASDFTSVFDVDRGMITKGQGRTTLVERLPGGKTFAATINQKVSLLTPEEVEKNKAEYAARQADLKQRLAAARATPGPQNTSPQGSQPPPAELTPLNRDRDWDEARVQRLKALREQASDSQDRSDPKTAPIATFRSKQIGSTAGSRFATISPSAEPVVGFQYELSNWSGKSVLRKLEPVYERPKGKPDSGYIGAREGYVVAGVIINSSEFANAFRVIFAKMNDGKTDSKTTYFSDWVGRPQGDTETRLGNNGAPVVGVFGTHGMNVHGFGLVQSGEPLPLTGAEAEKAKKKEALIETYWQQPTAKTTDLLPDIAFNGSRNSDGTISLRNPGQFAETIPRYIAPATFRIVLKSDGSDLRLSYAADEVIFNWEVNPDELRVNGGPAHGQHKPGAGALPANEWVAIEWVVRLDEMYIYVNGKERYRARNNFTKIDKPLTIRAQQGGLIIRSAAFVQ